MKADSCLNRKKQKEYDLMDRRSYSFFIGKGEIATSISVEKKGGHILY